MEYSNN
ncbi:Protein of unknown function [Bacillus cereus]|nr:Protein of unknown function [Bacillus cereus]